MVHEPYDVFCLTDRDFQHCEGTKGGMMRGEEEWRCKAFEARPTIDHVCSVTGMQKLCKMPAREVHHNRKTPKIENLPL